MRKNLLKRVNERFEKFYNILRHEFLSYIYRNTLRKILPRKYGDFNGLNIYRYKLFDSILTSERPNRPDYEQALCNFVDEAVSMGDRVVIVGGGEGVSSFYAVQNTQDEKVTVFEASKTQYERIKNNLSIYENFDINIRHAAVEAPNNIRGDLGNPEMLTTEDLPTSEVMVMDCEGAEKEILQKITNMPSRIVVETHGVFGSPTEEIRSLLKDKGYSIKNESWENKEQDVKVLLAERKS